jgi:hypothetical protein
MLEYYCKNKLKSYYTGRGIEMCTVRKQEPIITIQFFAIKSTIDLTLLVRWEATIELF